MRIVLVLLPTVSLERVSFDRRTARARRRPSAMRAPRSGSNPPPQRDGALLHLALRSIGHVADDVADEVTAIGRGHRISVGVARLDGVDRPDKSAHGRVVLSQS